MINIPLIKRFQLVGGQKQKQCKFCIPVLMASARELTKHNSCKDQTLPALTKIFLQPFKHCSDKNMSIPEKEYARTKNLE